MYREKEDFSDDEPPGDFDEGESPKHAGSTGAAGRSTHPALRDLSDQEQRLIVVAVNTFWRRWGPAFTALSYEDLLGVAVIALHEVAERAAALPTEGAVRLRVTAIWRRCRKRLADDFRQRLQRRAWEWAELDPERLQALAAESTADWEAVLDEIPPAGVDHERLVAALHTLAPLDRRILNLHFGAGLTYREIAIHLNATPEELPRGRPLTDRAVENRCERAIHRLRALLAVVADE